LNEIKALKTLYEFTNGPKWRKNKWPIALDGDPCKWAGVTCKEIKGTRHVVSLAPFFRFTAHSLPPLSGQVSLSHEHTYAGGSLPAALADLTEVELLDLGCVLKLQTHALLFFRLFVTF